MMSNLMFPKPTKKKKRKSHPKPIIDTCKGECFLCKLQGRPYKKYTEEHHVFYGGGLRDVSEQNGFKVYLCPDCHKNAPYAVHNSRETRVLLCRIVQKKYEETHTREEFTVLIGKNYL